MNCKDCGGRMFKIDNNEQLHIWDCNVCGNTIVLDSFEEEIAYCGENGAIIE